MNLTELKNSIAMLQEPEGMGGEWAIAQRWDSDPVWDICSLDDLQRLAASHTELLEAAKDVLTDADIDGFWHRLETAVESAEKL